MANNVTQFFTKETKDGKKHKIPILGKLIGDHDKKKEREFELNEENIQGLTGYSEQHKEAIMLAAQKLQVYQQGFSANYTMAMEDVGYLHSLLLKGVDTHAVYQLLMSNPGGAARLIKAMGLSNVSVADTIYSPGRSNLVANVKFEKDSTPVTNLGIIPIGDGLYMGLADTSTFYYLVGKSKNSPGVLYPINTMRPGEFSAILNKLSNTQFIESILTSLQQFNTTVGTLVGSGARSPQQVEVPAGMSMGGVFSPSETPGTNPFQEPINFSVPPGMGGPVVDEPQNNDQQNSGMDKKQATKVLLSGLDDAYLSKDSMISLRSNIGGKGLGTAANVARLGSMIFGLTSSQAADYVSGKSYASSAVGRELSEIGKQLKNGKFHEANRFVRDAQRALIQGFAKQHPNEDIPDNPIGFAEALESNSKLKSQWLEYAGDSEETSNAYDEYLENIDDDNDSDSKN